MASPRVSGAWLLEGLVECGPEGGYMVDPISGIVYIARSATSWPEPVGWLTDAGAVQRADMDVEEWCKQISAVFNVSGPTSSADSLDSEPCLNMETVA